MANTRRNKTEREEILAAKRKKRKTVGDSQNILTVDDKEDGYVYRWVNDTDNRIASLSGRGWENVNHDVTVGDNKADTHTNIGDVVSKGVGKGTTAYLMRIEKELYDEDKAGSQKQLDERDRAMKAQLNSGADGSYGKVEIK